MRALIAVALLLLHVASATATSTCHAPEQVASRIRAKLADNKARDATSDTTSRPMLAPKPISLAALVDPSKFTDADRATTHAELLRAFTEEGFAIIQDHGVPVDLMHKVMDVSRAFHALPRDYKETLKNASAGGAQRGFRQLTERSTLYTFGPPSREGKNGVNFWSSEPAELKAVITQYYGELERVERVLLKASATALGVHEGTFVDRLGEHRGLLSLNHNTRLPQDLPCPAGHTDWGVMTILMAPMPGLEILPLSTNVWSRYPPSSDKLIVNVGDALEGWTGGRFVSTMHRVCAKDVDLRYSVPFFGGQALCPDDQSIIKPVFAEDAERFPPVSHKDYIDANWQAFRELHAAAAAKAAAKAAEEELKVADEADAAAALKAKLASRQRGFRLQPRARDTVEADRA